MSVKQFGKIDGIDGESTSQNHENEIEILSWGWGLSAPSPVAGSGRHASNVKPRDFTFTHRYDKSSPLLARAAGAGARIKLVSVSVQTIGNDATDFLTITMRDVRVTALEQVADESNGVAESVSMTSEHITFEYRPVDTAGAAGPPVTFDWDIASGAVH